MTIDGQPSPRSGVYQVSGRVPRAALRVARRLQLPLAPLVEGTGLQPGYIDAPPAWVAWDDVAVLVGRIAEAAGDLPTLERAVELGHTDAAPMLHRMLGLVASPADLYRLAICSYGPALYPMLETSFVVNRDGSIHTGARLPDDCVPSEPFMHVLVGFARGLPRHLDLPSAAVVAQVTPRSVQLAIVPPASRTLRARTQANAAALAGRCLMELESLTRDFRAALDLFPTASRVPAAPRSASRLDDLSRSWALTGRQREVLGGLIRGLSNKEIAVELGCALPTVGTHVMAIFRKAGVTSRRELMRRCFEP